MGSSFSEYLMTFPPLRALGVLRKTNRACSHRELADLCSLSVAGMQDVLRRLEECKLVKKEQSNRGSKTFYSLSLSNVDLQFLDDLLTSDETTRLVKRVEVFSKRLPKVLGWIDETLQGVNQVKQHVSNTSQTT